MPTAQGKHIHTTALPPEKAAKQRATARPALPSSKMLQRQAETIGSQRQKAVQTLPVTVMIKGGQLTTNPMPAAKKTQGYTNNESIELALGLLCTANHLPLSRAKLAADVLLGRLSLGDHARLIDPAVGVAKSKRAAKIVWPKESYSTAHKEHGEDIVAFLRRVWRKAITDGATRKDLRDHDPSADVAVSNYLRPTRKFPFGRQLPSEVALPTLKERNDLELATVGTAVSELARLAQAARRRSSKAPSC